MTTYEPTRRATNGNPTEGEIAHLAERLVGALISPNESDSNGEPANVVDGLYRIAQALHHVARAIEGRSE